MDARRRLRATALAAASTALIAAAPAGAAYAPQFSFKLDPATPDTAATITSTITQAAGESASKTVTVTLPPGFSPNLGNQALKTCSADQELVQACPADSRMGQANATVVAFGMTVNLAGPVYFGGLSGRAFRLILLLSEPQIGTQKLIGLSTLQNDGSVSTVFDELPNFLTTAFTLVLEGGDRALLKTPSKCGSYPVTANFVSHNGESASATSPTTISGCSASGAAPGTGTSPAATVPLTIGAARLSRLGTATFSLNAPSRVTVTVTRSGRRVARRTVAGKKGVNRVRLGRRLKSGRYVVTVSGTGPAGRKVTKRTTVRLR